MYVGEDMCIQGFDGGNLRERIPRCRWEDNIKMDLQYKGRGGLDWALGKAVMKSQFPHNAENFLTS